MDYEHIVVLEYKGKEEFVSKPYGEWVMGVVPLETNETKAYRWESQSLANEVVEYLQGKIERANIFSRPAKTIHVLPFA